MIQEPDDYSIHRMSTNTRQQCYCQQDVPDPQACIYPELPSLSGVCALGSDFCHQDVIKTMEIV